jgi:polyether ionophore transport system ATP-binding protein
MSASTPAIEITGLRKSFGRQMALDGLDLTVETGQIAGFLGPNGAGKSTTIRILLGLLRADGGHASLLGGDPWRDAVALHRRIAYVPGEVSLWPNLTGGQAIDIICRLRGGVRRERITRLLERFELDPTKKARAYSKGNRQKVALVAALASEAELLILDEPTSGLDPLMEATFRELVREVRTEGRSVLLSSHIFAEVESVCDTVTIIRQGRTVEHGTLRDLRHLHRTTIAVTIPGGADGLAAMDGVHDLTVDGEHCTFTVADKGLSTILGELSRRGAHGLVATPPSLEELFLRHYGASADHSDDASAPSGQRAVTLR